MQRSLKRARTMTTKAEDNEIHWNFEQVVCCLCLERAFSSPRLPEQLGSFTWRRRAPGERASHEFSVARASSGATSVDCFVVLVSSASRRRSVVC